MSEDELREQASNLIENMEDTVRRWQAGQASDADVLDYWDDSKLRQRAEAAEQEAERLREVLTRIAAGARGFGKVAEAGSLERYNFSTLAEVAEAALQSKPTNT